MQTQRRSNSPAHWIKIKSSIYEGKEKLSRKNEGIACKCLEPTETSCKSAISPSLPFSVSIVGFDIVLFSSFVCSFSLFRFGFQHFTVALPIYFIFSPRSSTFASLLLSFVIPFSPIPCEPVAIGVKMCRSRTQSNDAAKNFNPVGVKASTRLRHRLYSYACEGNRGRAELLRHICIFSVI